MRLQTLGDFIRSLFGSATEEFRIEDIQIQTQMPASDPGFSFVNLLLHSITGKHANLRLQANPQM